MCMLYVWIRKADRQSGLARRPGCPFFFFFRHCKTWSTLALPCSLSLSHHSFTRLTPFLTPHLLPPQHTQYTTATPPDIFFYFIWEKGSNWDGSIVVLRGGPSKVTTCCDLHCIDTTVNTWQRKRIKTKEEATFSVSMLVVVDTFYSRSTTTGQPADFNRLCCLLKASVACFLSFFFFFFFLVFYSFPFYLLSLPFLIVSFYKHLLLRPTSIFFFFGWANIVHPKALSFFFVLLLLFHFFVLVCFRTWCNRVFLCYQQRVMIVFTLLLFCCHWFRRRCCFLLE